jgi:hypothetical protein
MQPEAIYWPPRITQPPKHGMRCLPARKRVTFMAKVFTITVPPNLNRKKRERTTDPRYVDGQRILVEAMKYLAKSDPLANRRAIELISEHVRTRFRMSDSPLG